MQPAGEAECGVNLLARAGTEVAAGRGCQLAQQGRWRHSHLQAGAQRSVGLLWSASSWMAMPVLAT